MRRMAHGLMVLLDVVTIISVPRATIWPATLPDSSPSDIPYAVGCRDRFPASRRVRDFLYPQRALLARGVPLRRPALRCRARDHRPERTHILVELARARGRGRSTPGASGARERAERGVLLASGETRRRLLRCAMERRPAPRLTQTADRRAPGYYGDFADELRQRLARGLAEGFVYQGEPSRHAEGRRAASRSRPAADGVHRLPAESRPGRQSRCRRAATTLATGRDLAPARRAAAAPHVPMLFMGEEWGAPRRSSIFCDFHGELARARSAPGAVASSRPSTTMKSRCPTRWRSQRLSRSQRQWSELDEPASSRPGLARPGSCWRCDARRRAPAGRGRAARGSGRSAGRARAQAVLAAGRRQPVEPAGQSGSRPGRAGKTTAGEGDLCDSPPRRTVRCRPGRSTGA